MTSPGLADRLGPRSNTSAANNASWLVAVGILAVVIPASEKVAANEVFFAAHGVSPMAWVVLLVAGVLRRVARRLRRPLAAAIAAVGALVRHRHLAAHAAS